MRGSLLAVKARERQANPVKFRGQQSVWRGEENTHGVECMCVSSEVSIAGVQAFGVRAAPDAFSFCSACTAPETKGDLYGTEDSGTNCCQPVGYRAHWHTAVPLLHSNHADPPGKLSL